MAKKRTKKPPTLERLQRAAWTHTHRDFRGRFEDGTRTVLKWVNGVGTTLVTIDELTREECLRKIPASALAKMMEGVEES